MIYDQSRNMLLSDFMPGLIFDSTKKHWKTDSKTKQAVKTLRVSAAFFVKHLNNILN